MSMNRKNSNITIESNATNSSDLDVTTHYPNITAARLASNDILDLAYSWVCKQTEPRSHNNSVWDLRFNWETRLAVIQSKLLSSEYRLSPLRRYDILGEFISSWAASDAGVLKALTLTLQPLFSVESYTHCTNIKDAGGSQRIRLDTPILVYTGYTGITNALHVVTYQLILVFAICLYHKSEYHVCDSVFSNSFHLSHGYTSMRRA